MEEQDLQLILNAIESGKCLAFLGADACTPYKKNGEEQPGLPTGSALGKWLAKQCKYKNGKVLDLSMVAEYFVYTHGGDREALERAIQKKIQIKCTPRPIHTVLAQIKHVKVVITSNYDTLLENEFAHYGRNLIRHVYNPQNPKTGHFDGPILFGDGDIVLHKMHGSVDELKSMVITQSDYIHYLANLNDIDRGMPEYFRKIFIPRFTLLFLGYSLADWNFRIIWEGVLSFRSKVGAQKDAYALVKNPSNFDIRYWAKRNIVIIDMDLTEFAIKLAEHFKLDIPQLEIKKGKHDSQSV